jgi:transcriptional regulator with XRE-family HTH domain
MNQTQLRLSSKELAKHYLGKGIRKPRFRETKAWTIQNRILMALLYAKDLKISEFAEMVGVHHRTAASWIYEGTIPKKKRFELISEIVDFPAEFIFDEALIGTTIEIPEESRFLERVWGQRVVNRLLAGLMKVHNVSPTDVSRWCKMSSGTLRKYVHEGVVTGNREYQDRLAKFFRIPPHILFYEGTGIERS